MEYPLCRQRVTVYRLVQGQVQRQVLENCYLHLSNERIAGDDRDKRTFLLVVPGQQRIFPGDRLLPGVGYQVDAAAWKEFLHCYEPELLVVSRVDRYFVGDQLSHIEAR